MRSTVLGPFSRAFLEGDFDTDWCARNPWAHIDDPYGWYWARALYYFHKWEKHPVFWKRFLLIGDKRVELRFRLERFDRLSKTSAGKEILTYYRRLLDMGITPKEALQHRETLLELWAVAHREAGILDESKGLRNTLHEFTNGARAVLAADIELQATT